MQLINVKIADREYIAISYTTDEAPEAGQLLDVLVRTVGNRAIAINSDNVEMHENLKNGDLPEDLRNLLDEYQAKRPL